MKKLLILLLLFIFCKCICQSTSDILLRYKKDERFLILDKSINEIGLLKFRIPFLEEINFRTETDRNNLARQEFAIRAMFNGFGESKYYSQQKDFIQTDKQLEKIKIEKSILIQNYKQLIDLYYLKQKLPLYDSIDVLFKSKITLLVKAISAGEYISPKDVIKIEADLYKNKQDKEETFFEN